MGKREATAMQSKISERRPQSLLCMKPGGLRRLRLVALCCAVLGSSQALAAEAAADACLRDTKCRQLDDAGIEASERKDYNEALKQFQAAYERVPLPRLLLNIGRSMHHLGQYQDALSYYDRFNSAAPRIDEETAQIVARFQTEARDRLNHSAPSPLHDDRAPKYPVAAGVLCGLGGAALIAGGGLGLAAMQAAKAVVAGDGPADQVLYEQGRAMGWAALSLGIAGGVAGLVGTVWSIKWSREQRRTSTVAVVPAPSGVFAFGSF